MWANLTLRNEFIGRDFRNTSIPLCTSAAILLYFAVSLKNFIHAISNVVAKHLIFVCQFIHPYSAGSKNEHASFNMLTCFTIDRGPINCTLEPHFSVAKTTSIHRTKWKQPTILCAIGQNHKLHQRRLYKDCDPFSFKFLSNRKIQNASSQFHVFFFLRPFLWFFPVAINLIEYRKKKLVQKDNWELFEKLYSNRESVWREFITFTVETKSSIDWK